LLALLVLALLAGSFVTLRGFGLALSGPANVRAVPPGHQEIAWIGPATSGDTWERLVAAVRRLQDHWSLRHADLPPLHADLDHVFTERTTDVPELALRLRDADAPALWIRWYKTSSELDARAWLEALAQRERPPVAILGGENSESALSLGRLLAEYRGRWSGPAPLFLITTATADRYARENQTSVAPLTAPGTPKLMNVYKGRSFRFSFTNSRMAAVVMAFVKDHPEVWSLSLSAAALPAGAVATADSLACLALLSCRDELPPICLYAVAWADDPYSIDLADRFGDVFRKRLEGSMSPATAADPGAARITHDVVAYGVGDRDRPNPVEAHAIDSFFDSYPLLHGWRELLVLPTGTERARRFLRTVANQGPEQITRLVVLSGDAITFNNVFRDRDAAWNVQDMPLPVVFFSHRDPIDAEAGFRSRPNPNDRSATTGTQDLLLYRDIIEALLLAAGPGPATLNDAEQTLQELRRLHWRGDRLHLQDKGIPFLDADGNRHQGTGEHVVWLQPQRRNGRVLAQATISVWGLRPDRQGPSRWRPAGEPLTVLYDWPARGS